MATAEQYAEWIVNNADKKGTPEFETVAEAYKMAKQGAGKAPTRGEAYRSGMMDPLTTTMAGALRGTGSIGATMLRPMDWMNEAMLSRASGKQVDIDRRGAMDEALRGVGAQTDSAAFQGGKLFTEILGTLGIGNTLAAGASAIPAVAKNAPGFVNALRTGGMTTGNAPATFGAKAADLAGRVAGGGATGFAAAGMVNPEDAKTGAMFGAALPAVVKGAGFVGGVAGKAMRGDPAAPEVVALAKRAAELGIDIPADRIAQSKPLDAVASGLNYVPFSGRAATEAKMGEQLNIALSRTFGQNSPNITAALRKADAALGGQFDDFLRKNAVNADEQFVADLADAANKASRELGSDGASIIAKQVDDIIAKAGSGQIDGQAAYNIKKTLDRIGKRNSPEAWYAIDLKQKLMEALNRSVGQQKAEGFSQLRKQYGNMMELEKLAKNGAEGEISIARLANLKHINNPDLQELADIAAQFVKAREGQHGAMQRAVVGSGVASAAASTMGLPGLAGVAALSGGARGTNALLNSAAARSYAMGNPANALLWPDPDMLQFGYRATPVLAGDR